MNHTGRTFKRAALAPHGRDHSYSRGAGIIGWLWLVASAAALVATAYLSVAHGSDRGSHPPAPTPVAERAPQAVAADQLDVPVRGSTFHDLASLDGNDPEPDPSPRAVAAYGD